VETPKVIVVWSTSDLLSEGIVNVLDSHTGVRVYDKDVVDSRLITEDEKVLPYFNDMPSALCFMSANPNKSIQLDLDTARKHNLY
jgi:hypothetical protein